MALQHLYMGRVMWHPGMWMNSLCQLLPIGFCGVVYELGKGRLSSSTTLLTQCFRKKPEEIFMALDFNFLGKPSSASPAPHGNTASIPTEGHDLHWHLYVTVPATRYPLGGSFVHRAPMCPQPCSAASHPLRSRHHHVDRGLLHSSGWSWTPQTWESRHATTTPTHSSLDHTCQPNCATAKATSGPHHLPSLVPADVVSLISDVSCSLHPLEKKKRKKKHSRLNSPLKCQYISL